MEKWNYSLTHRGLNAHFLDLYPPKFMIFCPQTQDQVSAYVQSHVVDSVLEVR